jgi:class 3 adenylate cyclase
MEMPASSDIFLFTEFRLDRAGGGLFRRDHDGAFVPVAIGSRALDILAVLLERRGDIVSKEELMAVGWPNTVVAESNLFVQISALRRALDREQSAQSFVQTITGRGYRVIIPVTRSAVNLDDNAAPSPREHLLALSSADVGPFVPSINARLSEPQLSTISSGERRQLTVMSCTLIGFGALSSRLDPEDLRDIIGTYHHAVAEAAAEFGGFVGGCMGDSVLVHFGYPRAHEDDAERAVRAALGLINAVRRLGVEPVELHTRIGIATGLVVVGDPMGEGSAKERSVVGEAPNLAAHLQGLAEPDTVVIASATHRLVRDLFEYRELGAIAMEGRARPVPAWQVLRPSIVASRFDALRGSVLSPLVGREEELDLLLRRWARAKAGNGQVVLVSGELGLGKSRLAAAFEGASTRKAIFTWATSARLTTRTARFIRSSTSSAGRQSSAATTRRRQGWKNSGPSSL